MRVMPPELAAFSTDRYRLDLTYRREIDCENSAERNERIKLLFKSVSTNV